jgi:hypothetical protein
MAAVSGMLSSTLTKPSNVGKRVPRAQHQGTASDQRDLGVDSFHVYKADEVIRRAVSAGGRSKENSRMGSMASTRDMCANLSATS